MNQSRPECVSQSTTKQYSLSARTRFMLYALMVACALTAGSLLATIIIDSWRVSPLATGFCALAMPTAGFVIALNASKAYARRRARREAFLRTLEDK
jgi:hypothetical protein